MSICCLQNHVMDMAKVVRVPHSIIIIIMYFNGGGKLNASFLIISQLMRYLRNLNFDASCDAFEAFQIFQTFGTCETNAFDHLLLLLVIYYLKTTMVCSYLWRHQNSTTCYRLCHINTTFTQGSSVMYCERMLAFRKLCLLLFDNSSSFPWSVINYRK